MREYSRLLYRWMRHAMAKPEKVQIRTLDLTCTRQHLLYFPRRNCRADIVGRGSIDVRSHHIRQQHQQEMRHQTGRGCHCFLNT